MSRTHALRILVLAVLLAGASACGSDERTPSKSTPATPPTGLSATTDRSEGVLLEWTPPAGAEAIVVERDGTEIARLGPDADRIEDLEAQSGSAIAADLAPATSGFDSVLLTWTAPQTLDGPVHEYVVVASFADAEARSPPATGHRAAPSIEALSLERDGTSIATLALDATSFVDDGADPWTFEPHELVAESSPYSVALEWRPPEVKPGMLHSYAVVATLSGGDRVASATRDGGRIAPSLLGYELLRDGEPLDTLERDVDFYLDEDVLPGSVGELLLEAGKAGSPAFVDLEWNVPETTPGPTYEYSLVARFDGADDLSSSPIEAGRLAPQIARFVIHRDGAFIAEVDPSVTTYEDDFAAPAILSAFVLQASRGTRADGVELTWDPTTATQHPHAYEVVAVLWQIEDEFDFPSGVATGARAAPTSLGYVLVTSDGNIDIPAGQTSYLDTSAPLGSLTMGPLAATSDRHDVVRLSWASPSATPGDRRSYSLFERFDGAPEQGSTAEGHRGPPPVSRFVVYRDGMPIESDVAGDSRSFDDDTASAPLAIDFASFNAGAFNKSVRLDWIVPSHSAGTEHLYEVTAIPEFGRESNRGWARGMRKLELTSLVLLRDGSELASAPPGSFTDTDVDQPTVDAPTLTASEDREGEILVAWSDPKVKSASKYRYQLVATLSDGSVIRSAEREAGVPDPVLLGFYIYRNGSIHRTTMDSTLRSFFDPVDRGTISLAVRATDGTVDQGVDVSWTVTATPGPQYTYFVEPVFESNWGQGLRTANAQGRSAPTSPTGFKISRSGTPIASLGGEARSYQDRDLERTATGPDQVFASMDRADAVRVRWTAPFPTTSEHLYSVEMEYSHGQKVTLHDTGHRKRLTLDRYIVLRDGVEVDAVPYDVLEFDDVGATRTDGLLHSLQASQGTRADGVALEWALHMPVGNLHNYTVEAIYREGGKALSPRQAGGSLAQPTLVDFELQRDDRLFRSIGTQTSHLDTDAPDGTADIGWISVGVDGILSYVTLGRPAEISWVPPSPARYRVRAIYDHGSPTVSSEFTGRRADVPKALVHVWQRSAGSQPRDFQDLPGGTSHVFRDFDIPVDEVRWYRVQTYGDGQPLSTGLWLETRVPGFKRVQAGDYTTCAIRTDDSLVCFGWNPSGLTNPPAGKFRELSAGHAFMCALRDDGDVSCWGENLDGEAPPTPIAGPFSFIDSEDRTTCGVRASDGGLSCWGTPTHGQVPTGSFSEVSLGWRESCALRADGTAECWGFDPWSFPGTYRQLSLGDQHACTLDLEGTISCQGEPPEIVNVPPGTYTKVVSGTGHSCGLLGDGEVRCWGDSTHASDPAPGRKFTQVSAGMRFSCGVREDSKLECWGSNSYGQAPVRP